MAGQGTIETIWWKNFWMKKKKYKNLNDDQNFENWMNILKKHFYFEKGLLFQKFVFHSMIHTHYPWVVSISSFVWLMIILRFQFFCSIYTVWNFQSYACYFFIWPNHKYILEQFLIIIDSSLLWIYFDEMV